MVVSVCIGVQFGRMTASLAITTILLARWLRAQCQQGWRVLEKDGAAGRKRYPDFTVLWLLSVEQQHDSAGLLGKTEFKDQTTAVNAQEIKGTKKRTDSQHTLPGKPKPTRNASFHIHWSKLDIQVFTSGKSYIYTLRTEESIIIGSSWWETAGVKHEVGKECARLLLWLYVASEFLLKRGSP